MQHPQQQVLALLKKGHPEQWISQKTKIGLSTIYRIKAGDIRSPRFDVVEKIQKLYQKHVLCKGSISNKK